MINNLGAHLRLLFYWKTLITAHLVKMADCLSLLREYNVQKKEIIERDNLIIFDQLAWPKHVKTNYLVFR